MPEITTSSIDDLLSQAEERLQSHPPDSKLNAVPAVKLSHDVSMPKVKEEKLSVRQPQIAMTGAAKKNNTAGSNWFDLPKTDMTPEFKREWQLLRMRGLLDPKHQKKALRANAPAYSQIGEVVAGPTDFYSSRLTRKEQKNTILEEVLDSVDKQKLQVKYAGIQRDKTFPKREQNITIQTYSTSPNRSDSSTERDIRRPRALQSIHLKPLKREAEFGIPSCDLQLRSFSVQPLEFFSDFALRAAYYLGLPAYGPVPLPRITERWTVPKSHFIFKKAQENFERVTLRRMIQIKDGNPDTVQLWLSYLRKHQFYGVGMKANIWEFGPAGVGVDVENGARETQLREVDTLWSHLGQTKSLGTSSKVEELLSSRRFQEANGLRQPPSISSS
ncbi:hypothetical protein E4U54_008072 [Claviceps lovelessii]|nr:hypothetical protein E4U54_008072 [Claviceps lovelessii]